MTALLLLRFAEYAGAALLFGAPLLLLYARLPEDPPGLRRLMGLAASSLTLAAPLHFFAQTVVLAGSLAAAAHPATLKAAFVEMDFGKASLVRGLAALLALAALRLEPPQRWWGCTLLGALACASFAWMGHGAATEGAPGWIHLAADIFHILAASGWLGALALFALWLNRTDARPPGLIALLRGFSALGLVFVGVILATGIVNGLFLIGSLAALWQSRYGQVLLAKVALFAAMLALAARNRALTLSPAVSQNPDAARIALRRSVSVEAALGLLVLALVSVLGMLPPPGQ